MLSSVSFLAIFKPHRRLEKPTPRTPRFRHQWRHPHYSLSCELAADMKHITDDDDGNPSTPGKFKIKRYNRLRLQQYSSLLTKFTFWSLIFLAFIFLYFHKPPNSEPRRRSLRVTSRPTYYYYPPLPLFDPSRAASSARIRSRNGISVLVTGAAGFVGTHVCAALKRRGDGVLGLDNFNSYYDLSLKRAREALLERKGVYIVHGDINDRIVLRMLFDLIPFTHVMHLAAQAGVRHAIKNPESYVQSNIAGFVTLLEACKNANPQPAIVWASSSSVYGLNTKIPFSEKDRTDRPASLYAASKKAGEEIAHTYNHIYGLSLTTLRFFTVYGPWGRPDMAYFFFTKDILKGRLITIFEGPDHGTVARDFTYIDDIVTGCLAALDTAEKSTGSSGSKKNGPAQLRVYNLGNTLPVPVSDLVSILERVLGKKAKRMIVKLPKNGDVQFTHANISLARMELGYNPVTDLQMGLKKFVRWYIGFYGKKGSH